MRRVVSLGLLGLGVFAVALGLLLRVYAYPRLAKAPLDVDTVSVATGSDITALVFVKQSSGASLPEIKDGLELTATRWVKGDLTQPEVVKDGDLAAWIESLEIVDRDGNRVRASERLVCLDRRTNEAREPCTNQYVQTRVTDKNVPIKETGEDARQPGLSFKFPFDTEQRGYQMYDLTIRDDAEAKFEGEEQIDGLDVYRFVQDIPPTKIDERKVPGSLIGRSDATVTADLYYQNKRTMWVEPQTGQIVKGQEEQLQELRPQDGGDTTAVFSGTLTFNDQTVRDNVADAEENKSQLWLLTTLPIILWIGGGLLIVAGIVLLLFWFGRNRGGVHHNPGPPQRQFAGASR